MTTLKAFFIVALVFGIFLLGPILAAIIGIGVAIWLIRTLLLLQKETNDVYTDSNKFVGGAHLFKEEERFSGTDRQESSREE